jgi:hypothetical protein
MSGEVHYPAVADEARATLAELSLETRRLYSVEVGSS